MKNSLFLARNRAIFGLFLCVSILCGFSFAQVNVTPAPFVEPQYFNGTLPCNGCLLYTYAAGTTTPLLTYTDSTGVTLNADPVVMDTNGYPSRSGVKVGVWLTESAYKLVLKTAGGATIWTFDGVTQNFARLDGSNTPFTGPISFSNLATFNGGATLAGAVNISGHISNANLNTGSAATVWGDSITLCYPVTTPQCYVTLLGTDKSWTMTNNGVSGSGIEDAGQADAMFATTVTSTYISTLLTGVNDMRVALVDATKQNIYKNALASMLAWLAIPSTNKVTGQSGSANLAYVGSWSNTSYYGGALGKQTTTQNDQVTISNVFGTSVYINTLYEVANTATFSVTIDGTSYGTSYSSTSTLTTAQGRTFSPYLLQIDNLTNSAHTVVLKKTDAGASPFYFLWIAGNGGLSNATGPYVYAGNCIRMTAAGYVSFGGSDTAVYQLNEKIKEAVARLAYSGLNVQLVDVAGYYDPATMAGIDGLHPNATGHTAIANAFYAALTQILLPRDREQARDSLGGSTVRSAGDLHIYAVQPSGTYYFGDTVGSDAKVTAGNLKATTFSTATNCSGVGTAANPSVASCSAAAAGSFSCSTAASGGTCTVNTTAVTANSQIFVTEDETLGTKLGVTCNTGTTVIPTSRLLSARVAATSFTINLGTVTTNPACFSYFIVN